MSPRGGHPAPSFVRVEVAITVMCTIRSNSIADYLNEANILISKSTLCNAGLGLFVYGLLWCYLSQNSLVYGTADFDISHVPNDIQSRFLNMECPFRQTQRK